MSLAARPRAVVTGAGGGLGAALVRAIARRGGQVVAADIDHAAVRAVAAGLADVHPVACDVASFAAVEALAAEAERRIGEVDLVINNAGVALAGRVGEVSIEDWRWIVEVNLWGVVHGCHAFAPGLRARGRGHILNVASAAGLLSPPYMAPYNATKAAVVALSETLYAELRADGVGVTVLCPTFFPTGIGEHSRGEALYRRAALDLVAAGSMSADDVAEAALAGVAAGALHLTPQADGRWLWRLKRLAPRGFQRLTPLVLDRVLRRYRE